MRIALLDSDIVAFQVAARNEDATAFGRRPGKLDDAKRDCDQTIKDLMKVTGSQDIIVCLSCREHNFRLDVLPTYKHGRDHSERPVYLDAMKEHMTENYETYLRYGLEADDVMGILATHPTLIKGEKVIISEDKDMRTIPSLVYAPHRPQVGIIDITPLQAAQFHMWQTVVGDVTDGYGGCPGVGKGSLFAEALLEEGYGELWNTVLLAYGSKGLGETEALVQARCAKILTSTYYDFKKKEALLWEPEAIKLG